MKYKLIKPVNPDYSALEQVLTNRGIPHNEIYHYLHTTDDDLLPPSTFGIDLLNSAAATLIRTISTEQDAICIVDADCDGFTSSAILINYLYKFFPTWTKNHLEYYLHSGKQHGLNDCIDYILEKQFKLVLIPDAGSNDVEECKAIVENGGKVIILDHHECDVENSYAIVINSQSDNYPNHDLSGAGVTWQFCRFLDQLLNNSFADELIDLAALGNLRDMMSLRSIETKHLIFKGFANVKNPFIHYMAERNSFSLKGKLTPLGAAFYIAPYVNAIVRSGTYDEKKLVFQSMLVPKAFEQIPSTKRGHTINETEQLVEQAIRTAANVKSRQTKAQDSSLSTIESMILTQNLLDHKVLLFLMKPGQIDKNIAGLIANKIMSKYQRPVCILTLTTETITERDEDIPFDPPYFINMYRGSARGCDKTGITNFKDICAATGVTEYETGHQGRFGLGIKEGNIAAFIEKTDELLKDTSDEAIYFVDYIFKGSNVPAEAIFDIASLADLAGKDMDESMVAIENLRVTADMVTVFSKKGYTLKITLPTGVTLMKFNATEEDCLRFQTNNTGFIELDIVGKCNINEWNDIETAQIFIEDWEIVDSTKYFF